VGVKVVYRQVDAFTPAEPVQMLAEQVSIHGFRVINIAAYGCRDRVPVEVIGVQADQEGMRFTQCLLKVSGQRAFAAAAATTDTDEAWPVIAAI